VFCQVLGEAEKPLQKKVYLKLDFGLGVKRGQGEPRYLQLACLPWITVKPV